MVNRCSNMKELEEKTRVETPQKGISENQEINVSEWGASIQVDLSRMRPDFKDAEEKLGVVLEELVNMLDLDGTGIDVYLLQYVVDARQSLRALLQLMADADDVKALQDGK